MAHDNLWTPSRPTRNHPLAPPKTGNPPNQQVKPFGNVGHLKTEMSHTTTATPPWPQAELLPMTTGLRMKHLLLQATPTFLHQRIVLSTTETGTGTETTGTVTVTVTTRSETAETEISGTDALTSLAARTDEATPHDLLLSFATMNHRMVTITRSLAAMIPTTGMEASVTRRSTTALNRLRLTIQDLHLTSVVHHRHPQQMMTVVRLWMIAR